MMHWIIAHLIGDYLIQNDWMAQGKKMKSWICTVHVLTYMLPFLLCGLSWWQLLLIAAQHWIQDRTTWLVKWMRFYQPCFSQPPFSPWSFIVVDNVVHVVFMAGVVAWIK